jgi:uncharacterized protein YbbK (DUF523 family)
MYIVSACLAGFGTRYDGGDSLDERVRGLVLEGRAIPVCPEQLAGLGTPRSPVEFRGGGGGELLDGKAIAEGRDGNDYTLALIRGAGETLKIARLYGVRKAILKDGSPSCGITYVYSDGRRTAGRGAAAELLARNMVEVEPLDPV